MSPRSEYNVNYIIQCKKGDDVWIERGTLNNLKCFDAHAAKGEARRLVEQWGRIVGASVTFQFLGVRVLRNTPVVFE